MCGLHIEWSCTAGQNGSCGQFMPGIFSVGQIQVYKNKHQSHDWQKASGSKSVFVRHFGVFSHGLSYGDNSNSAAKQIGSDDVAVRTAWHTEGSMRKSAVRPCSTWCNERSPVLPANQMQSSIGHYLQCARCNGLYFDMMQKWALWIQGFCWLSFWGWLEPCSALHQPNISQYSIIPVLLSRVRWSEDLITLTGSTPDSELGSKSIFRANREANLLASSPVVWSKGAHTIFSARGKQCEINMQTGWTRWKIQRTWSCWKM